LHLLQQRAQIVVVLAANVGAEAELGLTQAALNDFAQTHECTAADEQNVRGVDL
jgi:hypothetical protein